MGFNEIIKNAENALDKNDLKILKMFISKNMSSEKPKTKDITEIMSEIVEINCKKDKNGVSIPGTGEIFSNENKLKLIEYLKQNQIPVNRKTYTVAFKRYINGYIDLNNISNKKKTR